MKFNITARHLELTPSLSDYVKKKVEKAQRYFDSIIWAQAILTVEKHRHIAELVVHTPGSTFRTVSEAGDLYSAVDLAAHKLDLHLSRLKDKMKNHRIPLNSKKSRALNALGDPFQPAPLIQEKTRVTLESRSVREAMGALHSQNFPFYLFINEETQRINALYKKGKEGFGLVEAEV